MNNLFRLILLFVACIPYSSFSQGTYDAVTAGNFGKGDFTIEFSLKSTQDGIGSLISKKGTCGVLFQPNITIRLFNGGIALELADGVSYKLIQTARKTYNDGQKHYVAITRIRGIVSIYVDGRLDATDTNNSDINNSFPFTTSDVCSGPGGDGTLPYESVITDFRIWLRGLCISEIEHNAISPPAYLNALILNNGVYSSLTVTSSANKPNISVSASSSTNLCAGSSVTLTAAGGSNSFTWSTGETSASITVNSSGSYTASDLNSCFLPSIPVDVIIIPTPVAVITASGSTDLCYGGSVLLNAITGAGYTYQWNNAGGAINGATASTYTASTSGTYTVTVSSNGCSTTSSATTVTVNPLPTLNVSGKISVCYGSATTLTATSTISNPVYNWYTVANGGTPIFTGAVYITPVLLANTTYYVEVTGGCASSLRDSLTITVKSLPPLFLPGYGLNGGYQDGNIRMNYGSTNTLTVASPTPNPVYNWYDVAIGGSPIFTGASYTTPVLRANTTYYVEVTGECTSSPRDIIQLRIPDYAVTISGATAICQNAEAPTVTFRGPYYYGSYDFTYTINGGPEQTIRSTGNIATVSAPTSITGTFVYALVSFQSVDEDTYFYYPRTRTSSSATIIVRAMPTRETPFFVALSGNPDLCEGDSLTITAVPASSYLWSNGETTSSITLKSDDLFPGNTNDFELRRYTVAMTFPSGCSVNTIGSPIIVSVISFPRVQSYGSNANTVLYGKQVDLPIYHVYVMGAPGFSTQPRCSISGLPPGLRLLNIQGDFLIDGTPTVAGTFNYTFTVDPGPSGCGATIIKHGSITVNPMAPAISNCPVTGSQQLYASATNCSAISNYSPIFTGYPAPQISYTFSGATTGNGTGTGSGSFFNVGNTTVIITATNNIGSATCSFIVTVKDNIAPTATAKNITVYLDAQGQASIAPGDVNNGSNDNCGTVTLSLQNTQAGYKGASGSIASFNCSNLGDNTVNLIVTDASGNASTAAATVTIKDMIVPTITAPSNISAVATGSSGVIVIYTAPVGTDNTSCVTTALTAGLASGSTFPIGTSTVIYTATDAAGNSSSASLTVTVSGVAPVIQVPANSSVNNISNQCGANVSFAATETTGIPASTISYTENSSAITSGSFFTIGKHTITATATNALGSSTNAFTITVTDNEQPIITTNGDQSVNNDPGRCGAMITISANAADNCGVGIPTGVRSDGAVLTALYPVGTTTITWNVADIHGNAAVPVTQTIVVTDNEIPVITTNGNKSVNNDAGKCGATVIISANAADNCGVGTPTGVRSDGAVLTALYPVGTTTITWYVADIHGNAAVPVIQTIVVTDNEIPVITTNGNKSVNNDAGKCGATVIISANAADNCGVGKPTGVRSDGALLTALYPVGTTTITWNVSDIHSNAAVPVIQTIVVTDNEIPVITTNGNKSVNNDAGKCGATVIVSATAADNCVAGATTGTRSDGLALTALYPIGTTTITWNVSDIHSNVAVAVIQTITVTDNEKPTVITKAFSVTLLNGEATIMADNVNYGSRDNCGIKTMSVSPSVFHCNNIAANIVTLTVTDIHDNVFSATASVTVLGEVPGCTITSVPTNNIYTGGNPNNLYLGYGAQSATLKVTPVAASGNGGTVYPYTYKWRGSAVSMLSSTTSAAPVFTPTKYGYYTFTVTTTNYYGCSSTCTISICVTDIRVAGTNGSKVYVCHLPPGNAGNPQTLSISVNAVSAHLGNHSGDRLGSCDEAPCGYLVAGVTASNNTNSTRITKESEAAVTTEEELKVTVMPNPSATYFTLKLVSKYETPVNMRVMDANGKIVDTKSKIGANSTIHIGEDYSSGIYYAELIQGTRRKVVQLVKEKR